MSYPFTKKIFKPYSHNKNAVSTLSRLIENKKYDAIVSRYTKPAVVSSATQHNIPVILDIDDIDYQHTLSKVSSTKNYAKKLILKIQGELLKLILNNKSQSCGLSACCRCVIRLCCLLVRRGNL